MSSRDDLVSRFSAASRARKLEAMIDDITREEISDALGMAELIQKEYTRRSSTITDEARLLVGCLNALIAIAEIQYERHVMGTEHEKNDDNDNDGSSGTSDGHDHFEEEDSE